MNTFRLSYTVTFVVIFCLINLKGFSLVVAFPPKSANVELKSHQKHDNGISSNHLDLHLAMELGSTSINLKNVILTNGTEATTDNFHREINTLEEDNEGESPVVARSTKCNTENNNLNTQLDYLVTKFQTIEKTLEDLQNSRKESSVNLNQEEMCFRERKSLGVHYSPCTKQKTQKAYPKDCKEIQKNGKNVTGIYEIFPKHSDDPILVLCDMETRGGGWTHIQKRFDGSQDFYLEWRDYKFGFGNLDGEFWLGLQNMYLLSGFEPTELLVEIVDRDNVSAYAHYTSFAIGPEPGGYKLDRLSGFSGDAGDSLTYHLGSKFSTKDLDFSEQCATKYLGGWWYKSCHYSNLNGKFINIDLPSKLEYQGLHWHMFRDHKYSHSKSRMLLRPFS